jgi:hypothetical protein
MGAVRDHSIAIACIGAGSAIIAAFAKPICETLFPGPEQPRPPAVAAAPVEPVRAAGPLAETPITPTPQTIEGAWKQYVLDPIEGDIYIGTFVVSRYRGDYVISPRTQNEGQMGDELTFQTSIGIFDVAYDGQRWTFNSNWGQGEVGNFELARKSATTFEGEIRVAGKLSNRTRMVKIE